MYPQLQTFTRQLFLDFCAFFSPEWPLNFFVITIHQVIWPSPGTLPQASLRQTQADPRLVGKTDHNVGGLACILGLTNSTINLPNYQET